MPEVTEGFMALDQSQNHPTMLIKELPTKNYYGIYENEDMSWTLLHSIT